MALIQILLSYGEKLQERGLTFEILWHLFVVSMLGVILMSSKIQENVVRWFI